MGDAKRNTVFSQFIKRQFPVQKYPRILSVAEGKGRLANKLALLGYKVTVIEANPRAKHIRDGVTYLEGWFTRDSEIDADLVIGLHPDEATSEIVLAAEKANKSWAVVPCCVLGAEAPKTTKERRHFTFDDWIKKLRELSLFPHQVQREKLAMDGKNDVLWRRISCRIG